MQYFLWTLAYFEKDEKQPERERMTSRKWEDETQLIDYIRQLKQKFINIVHLSVYDFVFS